MGWPWGGYLRFPWFWDLGCQVQKSTSHIFDRLKISKEWLNYFIWVFPKIGGKHHRGVSPQIIHIASQYLLSTSGSWSFPENFANQERSRDVGIAQDWSALFQPTSWRYRYCWGRNSAPVDMANIPLFTGFHTYQVVVWDFFHQQYVHKFHHGVSGFQFRITLIIVNWTWDAR